MHPVVQFIRDLLAKLRQLSLSAKFWALITSLIVIAQQASSGEITNWQAALLAVGALSTYSIAKAHEESKPTGTSVTAQSSAGGAVTATVEASPTPPAEPQG